MENSDFQARLSAYLDQMNVPKKNRPKILADVMGVHEQTVYRWLRGATIPDPETLYTLISKVTAESSSNAREAAGFILGLNEALDIESLYDEAIIYTLTSIKERGIDANLVTPRMFGNIIKATINQAKKSGRVDKTLIDDILTASC